MARRVPIAMAAAVLFAVGLLLAQSGQEPVGVGEATPPVDVVGTVTSVATDELKVRTDQGEEWKFKQDAQTQRLPNVAVGDRVRVRYKDAWGTDVAVSVMNAPTTGMASTGTGSKTMPASSDPTPRTDTTNISRTESMAAMEGVVVSTTPREVVIRIDNGEQKTFVLGPSLDRDDLHVGNRVRLNYDSEGGIMTARSFTTTGYDTARVSDTGSDLPGTASPLPLIGLAGALSLLAGSALRFRRNRRS